MLATIGLWVLTGGIYGIVALAIDMIKLRKVKHTLKSKQVVLIVFSFFVPFLNIFVNKIFNDEFKKINEEMGILVKMNMVVCTITSIFFPLFMDPVSLAYRTNCFNAISDKITGNKDKVN